MAAGLLEPRGSFTPRLQDLLAPVARARRHIRVAGPYGANGITQFDAWADGEQALAVSRPSHGQLVHGHTEHAVPDGSVQLDLLRVTTLPLAISAWAGLAPAYTVMGRTDRLPMHVFQERLDGGGHSP